MPAMASVPKCLKVSVLQICYPLSSPIVNSFHVTYTGTAPTAVELGTMANTVFGAWVTNMLPVQDETTQISQVVITDLSTPTSAVGISTNAEAAGALTGNPAPVELCAVAKQVTARRYRGGHAKNFLRVGDVTKLQANSWLPIFQTAVQAAWGAFIDAVIAAAWVGAGTLVQAAVSYFLGSTNFTELSGRVRAIPTPRGGGPLVDAVVGTIIDATFGSQRRRLQR
jgi:hypothetical protein